MDAARRQAPRLVETVDDTLVSATASTPSLQVTVAYLLSETGRKASLLAGGNGRALQQLTLDVPASRLHLVSVDEQGRAQLRLRPHYIVDEAQRIRRLDRLPVYDVPPSTDDLFREAARNHQLERAFLAERTADRIKGEETKTDKRLALAKAFLADPSARALLHPPPTPTQCYLRSPDGPKVLFDAARGDGLVRQLPGEAWKRFRVDVNETEARRRERRAASQKAHEEKRAFVTQWLAEHGTTDQQARWAAGLMTMDEAKELVADQEFAGVPAPAFKRDGAQRLQAELARLGLDREVVDTDLTITAAPAPSLAEAEWRLFQRLRSAAGGEAAARERTFRLRGRADSPAVTVRTAVLTRRVGPLLVRREFELGRCQMTAPYPPSANRSD